MLSTKVALITPDKQGLATSFISIAFSFIYPIFIMKETVDFCPKKYTALLSSFFYLLFSPVVCGQVPQGVPKGTGPIDFSSTTNIIIYIVLPAIVLVAFIFWRVAIKKRRKENEEDF